jgi:V8-like Glu-specific endopeptidase
MLKVNYFLSLIFCIIISNFFLSQNRCLERLKQEAAKVDSIQYSTGTGFLINNDGYIVTNRHVIERAKELIVTFTISGKKIERVAELIGYSTFDDLAVIKVDVKNLFSSAIPYSFKKEQLSLGSKIYTLGFPDPSYMGTNIKLTDGLVNATTGFQDSESEYQISAPIQGGNSGSPMFDSEGFVRGVIVASYTAGQNVNYAIKGQKLINLLDAYKIKYLITKPSQAFKTNLGAIQSRICMITNMSVKTYYKEFSASNFIQNDNSRNFISKSSISNSDYLDCFKNNPFEAFGFSTGTKEKNWEDAIEVWDALPKSEEQIIYYTRFVNANGFNGMDGQNYFDKLFQFGAYENIIEEHNTLFNLNTQEIDFTWFCEYIDPNLFHFLDDFYWAMIYQYADYEPKKLVLLDNHLNNLLEINNKFSNQSYVKDYWGKVIEKEDQIRWTNENYAHLLQFKLSLSNILDDYFESDVDKCNYYNKIVNILSPESIWVKPPTCN